MIFQYIYIYVFIFTVICFLKQYLIQIITALFITPLIIPTLIIVHIHSRIKSHMQWTSVSQRKTNALASNTVKHDSQVQGREDSMLLPAH